jgi:hypothetical protein
MWRAGLWREQGRSSNQLLTFPAKGGAGFLTLCSTPGERSHFLHEHSCLYDVVQI